MIHGDQKTEFMILLGLAANPTLIWLTSHAHNKRKISETQPRLLQISKMKGFATTQPTITCSKLTTETLEQNVKYVQR